MAGNGNSYLLEPDDYGSYLTSTLRRIGDMPYTHLYAAVTMANDGTVYCHPGEFGTSAPDKISIFDPTTETWTSATASRSTVIGTVGFGNHGLTFVTDDGRIMDSYSTLNASEQPVSANLSLATHGSESRTHWIERGAVLLPDGRFMVFNDEATQLMFVSPGYSAGMISDGSSNVSAGVTTSPIIVYNRVSPWWRLPNVNAERNTWNSVDAPVLYEIGPAMYMPKIGKVVLIGGHGMIFTHDPAYTNSTGFSGVATLPLEPAYPDASSMTRYLGFVPASLNGVSPTTAISGGTFTFTSTFLDVATALSILQGISPKRVWVRLADNTKWVRINYTSAANGSGYNIVLSGCSFAAYPGANWDGTTLTTNDQVCLGRPSYEVHDGPGAILPNGDLIFVAGLDVGANDGFNHTQRVLKWDGSSSLAQQVSNGTDGELTNGVTGSGEYFTAVYPLPDGNFLFKATGGFIFYTPTSTESTPISGSKPVVSSSPSIVIAGRKFALTGTQLTGLHEGGAYGDDNTPRTNFPIVKFTNTSDNRVYFGRTRDFTYRGIQANRSSSCNVHVPENVPAGTYTLNVVTNGIPSTGVSITILSPIVGDAISMQ